MPLLCALVGCQDPESAETGKQASDTASNISRAQDEESPDSFLKFMQAGRAVEGRFEDASKRAGKF